MVRQCLPALTPQGYALTVEASPELRHLVLFTPPRIPISGWSRSVT
ncbi:hypothetical protein RAA17_07920 [Komagataeibacter rhaeticus]|nr:hypothetical protein [Komagataeibacter rhaeticus]